MSALAELRLWGRTIGAVSLGEGSDVAAFEYDADFSQSGIEVSPIVMPLSRRIYSFPELPHKTFSGLPGLLADSLPDKFGNALIDAWLATQGRSPGSFNAVERYRKRPSTISPHKRRSGKRPSANLRRKWVLRPGLWWGNCNTKDCCRLRIAMI